MSDSSIPSVNRPDDDKEPGPLSGASSASSLGAPEPDAETGEGDDADETAAPAPGTPDRDIKGDPDQVT